MSGVNPLNNSTITRFGSQLVDFLATSKLGSFPKELIFEILGQVRLDLPGYTRLTLVGDKFSTHLSRINPLHHYQVYIHRIALYYLDIYKGSPVMSLLELLKIDPKRAFKILQGFINQAEDSLNQLGLSSPDRSTLANLLITSFFLKTHMAEFPEMTSPLFERLLQINNLRSTLQRALQGSHSFNQDLISYCIATNKQDELAKFPLHQKNLIELERTKSFLAI